MIPWMGYVGMVFTRLDMVYDMHVAHVLSFSNTADEISADPKKLVHFLGFVNLVFTPFEFQVLKPQAFAFLKVD